MLSAAFQSSISPSRGQAPAPPSIPRRPGEGDSLVPTRPPPLPPVNTMPVPKPPGPFQVANSLLFMCLRTSEI